MVTSIQFNPAPLYRAQESAHIVMKTQWFSRYAPDYIQTQEGFRRVAIECYNHLYDGISFIDSSVKNAVSTAAKVGNYTLGWAIQPLGELYNHSIGPCIDLVRDAIYPINPVNGKRHFIVFPRSVEKFLGDYIFYPLNTFGQFETSELLSGTHESIAQRVNNVVQRLNQNNQELLNPSSETTKFEYRAKTMLSSSVNAFAVPAGGIVVFSQMVKELHGAIISNEVQESCIQFADGSHVKVDLRGVTLDDVLAALIGHEMTHAASRHSFVSICVGLIKSILLNIGRGLLIHQLQKLDQGYQHLKQKSPDQLSPSEQAELQSKQAFYNALEGIFAWVQEHFEFLEKLFQRRENEYEADVTGAYFTHQAQLNPLGAIYLREYLSKRDPFGFLHQHLEFLYTHPYGENRKRALFASIAEFAPQNLQGRLSQWHFADYAAYDPDSLTPAYRYCREIAARIG